MVGLVATGVLALGLAAFATIAATLGGNIEGVDSDALMGGDRPEAIVPEDPDAGRPLNIVVLGSDARTGASGDLVADGEAGARSDTTMVLHLSGDRTRVEVVSVPRDSTVDVPACSTTNGKTTRELRGVKFNSAFSQGYVAGGDVASGAVCTTTTLEQLSGVRMDGFVVVDFAGFAGMVQALGGVEVCVPEEVRSPKANNLHLQPGIQVLDGPTALSYARARTGEGLGNGSDLGRIGRQQELVAAMARGVLSKDLLTDTPALLKFLDAVTSSLTMSSDLASLDKLAGLAYSLRGVSPGNITFMTVPHATDPANSANVVWTDEAELVWDNMANDRPLSTPEEGASTSPSASPEATEGAIEAGTSPAPSPSPTVKDAGEEAFTGADTTSVC